MAIVYRIALAVVMLLGGASLAHALEFRTFTRDASIDYHASKEGRIGLRAEETYSFVERVPAGKLKLAEFLQSAPGRVPDRLVIELIRGGERTSLPAAISATNLVIDHPVLLRGDIVHVAADYAPLQSLDGRTMMAARAFSSHERWAEARLSFSGPGMRKLGLAIEGFQKLANNNRDDEKQVWIYRSGAPDLPEAHAVNAFEFAARFTLSEAVSWQALGRQFVEAFAAPPDLSDELRALARRISAETASPLEKASAIAKYIADEFWLENETMPLVAPPQDITKQRLLASQGSRLVAARLAHALLAIDGIEAEVVLSNRRALFTRPAVPLAAFDTAFIILKSEGRVLNPVTHASLLDGVPAEYAGKFALQLASSGPLLITNDMPGNRADLIKITAEISLSPKGQLSGLARTEATGASGAMLAKHVEGLARLSPQDLVRRLLVLQNLEGTAELHLESRAPENTSDSTKTIAEHSFTLNAQPYRQNMLRLPLFAGPRLIRPPQNPYLMAIQQGAIQPIACRPQRYEQDIVIHLPYARAIPDLKNDQQINLPYASYHAEYRLETAQRLHIKRQLVISPPTPICSRAFINEIAPVIRAAARDMERAISINAEGF